MPRRPCFRGRPARAPARSLLIGGPYMLGHTHDHAPAPGTLDGLILVDLHQVGH